MKQVNKVKSKEKVQPHLIWLASEITLTGTLISSLGLAKLLSWINSNLFVKSFLIMDNYVTHI